MVVPHALVFRPLCCAGLKAAQVVMCPAIWQPVCDGNNETYGNPCMAAAADANVICMGECPCPGACAGACCCRVLPVALLPLVVLL